MDYLNFLLFALIALFLLSRILPTKGIRHITMAELRTELGAKDKQFIDVRTQGEYKARSINQFKNIPLHDITVKASGLSKDQEVVVICQSGMRSNKASKLLKQQGFQKITNVRGGMNAW